MNFVQLMQELQSMLARWKKNEELLSFHQGDENAITKDFFQSVLDFVDTENDYIVMTKEELEAKMNDWHKSMEGYY